MGKNPAGWDGEYAKSGNYVLQAGEFGSRHAMERIIQIKAGREKSLLRRHPWIFSGAIDKVRGAPGPGETVQVLDAQGDFLAWAAYSPLSQIQARVWSWSLEEQVDPGFFRRRLSEAFALRQSLFEAASAGFARVQAQGSPALPATGPGQIPGAATLRQTSALRLVHAESDALPGVILDRYAGTLVLQLLTAGAAYWREVIAGLALELSGAERVYERSDVDARRLEGLPPSTGLLIGSEPPERIQVSENGLQFWVDVRRGHKTGFYLDQRSNRLRVRGLAAGLDVLDCFSYTGGFTISALAGGAASTLSVDSSAEALALAQQNVALNRLPAKRLEWLDGDVFQALRNLRDQDRRFDLVVLDPPKFAQTAAQAGRAARGYKDINLLAFKLLRPGGWLATFSCSGGVSADLFQKIVAGAALDAGVRAQIVETFFQDADHPVALNFPEGAYLKGLLVRVV